MNLSSTRVKKTRIAFILTAAIACCAFPAGAADTAAVLPLKEHQPRFFRAKKPLLDKASKTRPLQSSTLQAKALVVKPKAKTAAAGTVAVVNAASYLDGISPGGVATIFGADLSGTPAGVVSGVTDPLPLEIEGVSVFVNGVAAPLFSLAYDLSQSLDQISFQVPYDTATGTSAAEVQVTVNGFVVADVLADSFTEDPGIFTYFASNNLDYPVILRYPDYSLIGPDNPASPGDVLIMYTTGLGPLTVALQDGYGAPSSPLAYTVDQTYQTVLYGENCQLLFSGLAPGFVGLDQVNFVVPLDVPAGELSLQITTDLASSNKVNLPVQ